MNEPITVFILAAGLGERLRPITSSIPKPLVPILGKPVLQRVLEKISSLPAQHIGINLHYKGNVIEDWISGSGFQDKVVLFPEKTILGTGGALKNAESLLSRNTFLTYNSDILSGVDLDSLVRFHKSSQNLVTLAIHDYQLYNNLLVNTEGLLKGIGNTLERSPAAARQMAFTGIAVYNPDFLKFLPEGRSSVVDAWLAAIEAGHSIGTFDVSGCYWTDIGSPVAYAAAVIEALKADGETVYFHPSVKTCHKTEFDGFITVEQGVVLEEGVLLKNCILLPESRPEKNSHHENCMMGPDFIIPLSESAMTGAQGNDTLIQIGAGGSDRKYFRKKDAKTPAVLMQCSSTDPDFRRQIEYTRFFRKCGVPVPELLSVNMEEKEAVFEDLGDLSLYSWLKCKRPDNQVEAMYLKVLDIIVRVHSTATDTISDCPMLGGRIFDYDYLRWETHYFTEQFITRLLGIKVDNIKALEEEFHRLALKVFSFQRTIIHRDFQSQNIMVTKKGVPRMIDYQGARMAPPAYDVASVLWDPYHRLDSEMRERLLKYYISIMEEKTGGDFDGDNFRATLLPCRLQRHMQALGAYAFLSEIKEKKHFLKHVAEGLRLLKEDVFKARSEYPVLYALVTKQV